MKNDELKHLKSLWNAAAGEFKTLHHDELLPLIRRRAHSVFTSMRRNMLFEVILGSVAMLAWGWWVGRVAPGNKAAYLAALQMALLTVLPLFFFYFAGFRHLGRGMASDARMASALRQTIAYWDQALPLYFWGGAALLPSFLLSAFWFVNSLDGHFLRAIADRMGWLEIVAWIVGLSAVTMVFVWISLKISYAKHVKQLKACLRELEEAPQESHTASPK